MSPALDSLETRLGREWKHLRAARTRALTEQRKLRTLLSEFDSGDSTITAFGSLARAEFTPGSDLDWTLLVDGMVDPHHLDVALAVRQNLKGIGERAPGREGTFGNMAFSHDLVHQ